ncbi:MAG: hypothetical protein MJZ74_04150 [Muribaculaceae bacterium]|nr:hypothetical protein [Muribaculaceae bacterium]
MRKLFSVLLLVIAMPLTALAQDNMGSVVITQKDGTKLSIPRSGVAKITFDSIQLSALEEVDLGLSVKWANVNIDVTQSSKVVSSPEECGGYYGWADPTGLKTSDNKNDYPGMTRPKKISGTQYDIATQQLGDGWRLPTTAEFEELLTLKFEKTTINDVPGIQFTAENGNSIFLPLAGYRYKENVFQTGTYGYYWTGDLNSVLDWMAVELNLGDGFNRTSNNAVYNGCSVRAVKAK